MEKILLDMHTHSSHSPDADDSASAMCEKAAELGVKAYALTDHCDVNFWEEAPSPETIDAMMYGAGRYALASIAEQTELRERFAERLDLIVGIELGQPMQNIEKAELIANDPRLDFIIGKIPYPRIRVYLCLVEDLVRAHPTDTVDVGQTDLDALVTR